MYEQLFVGFGLGVAFSALFCWQWQATIKVKDLANHEVRRQKIIMFLT